MARRACDGPAPIRMMLRHSCAEDPGRHAIWSSESRMTANQKKLASRRTSPMDRRRRSLVLAVQAARTPSPGKVFTAPRSQHPPGGVCGTRLGSWYWAFDRDEEADVGAGVQPSLRVMAPVRRGEAMQPLGPLTLHLEAGIVAAYRPVRAQGDWKTFAAGAGAPHGEARAGKGGRKQGASMVVRRSFGAGRKRWARLGRYSSRARGHPRQPTASRNGVQEGSSSSPGARSAGRSGEASGPSDR